MLDKEWNKMDGFEKREACPDYWKDPRWKEVTKLKKRKDHTQANSLIFKIREDWKMEQMKN